MAKEQKKKQTKKPKKKNELMKMETLEKMIESMSLEKSPSNIKKKMIQVIKEKGAGNLDHEDLTTLSYTKGVSDLMLAESTPTKFNSATLAIADKTIQEYECKTQGEKALAHNFANAYTRMIHFSKRLHGVMNIEFLSHQKTGYYNLLSKELDRATRQMNQALKTLSYLKQPKIEIKVKADEAYFAQNQQVNKNKKHEEKRIVDA